MLTYFFIGKSAVTVQFTEGKFDGQYNPTIESCYKKTLKHGGVTYSINLVDTAGQVCKFIFDSIYNFL